MRPAGLVAAPTLDGVLVRLPHPGVLRLYRLDAGGGPGRYAPEWEAHPCRPGAWVPAACLRGPGDRVLVLAGAEGAQAWRLPGARFGRSGPLLEPLLRAALVLRSGWGAAAWAARVGVGAETQEAAVAQRLVASGTTLPEAQLIDALACRAAQDGAAAMQFAVALAELIDRPTPGTDALLAALADTLGEPPPERLGPDVRAVLGLPADWRARPSADLRRCWRQAAFAVHPDRGGDGVRFGRVQAAWAAVVADGARRAVLRRMAGVGEPERMGLWGGGTGEWRGLRAATVWWRPGTGALAQRDT